MNSSRRIVRKTPKTKGNRGRNGMFYLGIFFLVGLAPLRAELSFLHSEDFESFQKGTSYEGSLVPEEATPGHWERMSSGASALIKDGALIFEGEKEGVPFVWHAPKWKEEGSDEKGFTIEVRVRISPGGGFALLAESGKDGSDDQLLIIGEKVVRWGPKVLLQDADNTDRFHTFRIAKWAGGLGYDVWRDGELIGERETGVSESKDYFVFGGVPGQPGGAAIDYLRWDTTAAYCP